LILSI